MQELTNKVKKLAKSLGADLVGIAPVDRFRYAPLKISPQGIMPDCRSVIAVGIHHPDGCIELGGEPTPHDFGPYAVQGDMCAHLDHITFNIARFLEGKNYQPYDIVRKKFECVLTEYYSHYERGGSPVKVGTVPADFQIPPWKPDWYDDSDFKD